MMETQPSAKVTPLMIGLACGLVPMFLGCLIFALWCATDSRALQVLGILNMFVGAVASVVGGVSLVIYLWSERTVGWRAVLGVIAGIIIVLNYPLCGMIVGSVMRIEGGQRAQEQMRESSVRIINASDAEIGTVIVEGRSLGGPNGKLAARNGVTLFYTPEQARNIEINARVNNVDHVRMVEIPERGKIPRDTVIVIDSQGISQPISLIPRENLGID